MRMCVGCGEMKPKIELTRIVKTPENDILVDKKGKLPCKGVYGNQNNPFLQRLVEAMGMEDGWQE